MTPEENDLLSYRNRVVQAIGEGLDDPREGRATSDEEFLVRFVWTKSWFNAVGVKPAAFMPQVETRETSVFRHGIDPRDALMAIARETAPVGRNLHGAAFFQAGAVRQAELDVFPDEPPPRLRCDSRLALARG